MDDIGLRAVILCFLRPEGSPKEIHKDEQATAEEAARC